MLNTILMGTLILLAILILLTIFIVGLVILVEYIMQKYIEICQVYKFRKQLTKEEIQYFNKLVDKYKRKSK